MVSPTFILSGGQMRILIVVIYVLTGLGYYQEMKDRKIIYETQGQGIAEAALWPIMFGKQVARGSFNDNRD
ncbi:hypothetical protein EVB32_087 [Rhizobium phage RHph_TM39]|nr:hypothetical protein EVB32_087 [Rhizobium phage RHph_TM39]QIG77414.1 hypothetical protein EVB61_086 [Rhizobium phage RHph_TM21B]